MSMTEGGGGGDGARRMSQGTLDHLQAIENMQKATIAEYQRETQKQKKRKAAKNRVSSDWNGFEEKMI